MKKRVIFGCESRGDGNSPYLTRWTLLETRFGALYLHLFHRSDADDLHDHPWSFVSLILWRGYIEETPVVWGGEWTGKMRRRKWPGMLLFRGPRHTHRVELVDGKPAVTLVWRGRYVRDWGFHTRRGLGDVEAVLQGAWLLMKLLLVPLAVVICGILGIGAWWGCSWLLMRLGVEPHTAEALPFMGFMIVACIWAGVREARGK